MPTVQVRSNTVRNGVAAARRTLGVARKDSEIVVCSGGDDGLYRCHLANGAIIELTITQMPRGASAECQIMP